MQFDQYSDFDYGPGSLPSRVDSVNLSRLSRAISIHFRAFCRLSKLREGSMHKVYDIHRPDPQSSFTYVVRVACRAINRDKTESEVATMRYIKEHTDVPVPFVRSWNPSRDTLTGVEYVIMQKMPGLPASEVWGRITMLAKVNLVKQLVQHILDIFELRFECAGSLYMPAPGKYHVGPLVDPVFYEVVAGKELFSSKRHDPEERHVWEQLQEFRGPYVKATTWLAHRISAEMVVYKVLHPLPTTGGPWTPRHPSYCVEVMNEAVDLCRKYPGENFKPMNNPEQPFSFMLENDLSNIMIDEMGNITSFIDFADTQIVPLWMCAQLPPFLHPESDSNGQTLCKVFMEELARDPRGIEWTDIHTNGQQFREFYSRLCEGGEFNAEQTGRWLRKLEAWATRNTAVVCPSNGSPEGLATQ